MPSDQLLLEVADHVATVTFNRPKKMNAATVDMGEAMIEAFAEIEENDDVRVVILTGAGDRAFCAGDDVQEAWNDPRTKKILERLGGIRPPLTPESTTILGCSKPTIAAVNGLALGIGMDFAVMCDMRIASESASFALLYVKMGLMPDVPTYWRLPQLIGYEKAIELAMTGDFVDAREAERIGLVSRVVSPVELMPTASELAGKIAANPPLSIRHIKEGFRRATGRSYTDLQDVATFVGNGLARLFETKDHQEAAAAFLEKRAPVFEGH